VPALSLFDHNGNKDTSKCGGMDLDMKIPSMSRFIPMEDMYVARPSNEIILTTIRWLLHRKIKEGISQK
jgi:hypothetical protein